VKAGSTFHNFRVADDSHSEKICLKTMAGLA
jgi:hypothetical protein